MASATIALADTVPADGDSVTPGNQTTILLGQRAPGEVVTRDVGLHLACAGTNHAPAGATIDVTFAGATVPLDGAATATAATIGPVPSDWPATGQPCPSPAPALASNEPTVVDLTMPTTPGQGYAFSLIWTRSGATGLSGLTVITFKADVVADTGPTLSLPDPITVQGNTTNGAFVDYTVGAIDKEDDPDPTPDCDHASGSLFGLGTTTVACTVTDSAGMSAGGSFDVTVVDTIAPVLGKMPAAASATTGDQAGIALSYAPPTAADIVDPNPSIDCLPASGSVFPVGTSTVTCTASDASGNARSDTFTITVTYVQPVTWSAAWGEPAGSPDNTLVANAGRTIPVKVEIFANGAQQTSGDATLSVAACGGDGSPLMLTLGLIGGRWMTHLDTSRLAGPGCYVVAAAFDGNPAGSFRLELRGGETGQATNGPKAKPKN
jgi:hypothetical protein